MRRFVWALSIVALVPMIGYQPALAAPDKDEKKDESKTAKKADAKDTVAVFRINRELTEAPSEEGLFFGQTPLSLKEVIARLKKAKDDSAVKAVVMFHQKGNVGSAPPNEIR